MERLDQRRQVVAGEVGHQAAKLLVAALLDQARHAVLLADVVEEALAPGRAALEDERGVKLVRTIVDPRPQVPAAGLGERLLQKRAVFEDDDVPAEAAEQALEA